MFGTDTRSDVEHRALKVGPSGRLCCHVSPTVWTVLHQQYLNPDDGYAAKQAAFSPVCLFGVPVSPAG